MGYCEIKIRVTSAIRFAKKTYQKGLAECIKTKIEFCLVARETKRSNTIGDLKDKYGKLIADDKEKAEI